MPAARRTFSPPLTLSAACKLCSAYGFLGMDLGLESACGQDKEHGQFARMHRFISNLLRPQALIIGRRVATHFSTFELR